MGIQNLSKFLKEQCPEIYKDIHISEFCYKKIAIDTSLYMYVFKAKYQDEWLNSFLRLVECLRKNEIHCVFVYDGKAPPEKNNEKEERKRDKEKLIERIAQLELDLKAFVKDGTITDLLRDSEAKIIKNKSILLQDTINVLAIEEKIKKMKSYNFSISKEDFELTKKLFKLLDVAYIQAPFEAETLCADLCKQGLIDAVLSKDTDLLAYAAPIFLTNLDSSNGTCQRIDFDSVLEALGMTNDEFLDFCIMCGTDYNKNIPRIGYKTAFKLIKQYSSIENLQKQGIDVSVLNYDNVKRLFTKYERYSGESIPYCGVPNWEELSQFLEENRIYYSFDRMKRNFTEHVLMYESDGEENEKGDG